MTRDPIARIERIEEAYFRHAADPSRHASALVIETLAGAVNGTNRAFFATYVPVPGTLLVFFRRLVLRHGDGCTSIGLGRLVLLTATPSITGGQIDLPPSALYIRSFEPIAELTSDSMGAVPRPRRRVEMLPLFEQPRRRPKAA